MRLTNKQQEIIIDEIYNQVSKPIIEANNKALETVKLKPDQYQKDREKYLNIQKQIEFLREAADAIEDVYVNKKFNGFEFGYHPFNYNYEPYINYLKEQSVVLAEYHSKKDIEKDLILSGNKDIPELIKTIVEKYKK